MSTTESDATGKWFDEMNVADFTLTKKKSRNGMVYFAKPKLIETYYMTTKGGIGNSGVAGVKQVDTWFKCEDVRDAHTTYRFIEDLERHISSQVESIGTKWFTQRDVTFKSLNRQFDNNKYFIKWIYYTDGKSDNICFDDDEKPINSDTVQDGHMIKLLCEFPGIWVTDTQFGLAVIVKRIQVKIPKEESPVSVNYRFRSRSKGKGDDKGNREEIIEVDNIFQVEE